MGHVKEKPTYSIGAAARLSGLGIETVRIWERRYGVLQPARTVGGHRLYSDDDVELLRAVRALVERGQRPMAVFRLERDEILRQAASLPVAAAVEGAA